MTSAESSKESDEPEVDKDDPTSGMSATEFGQLKKEAKNPNWWLFQKGRPKTGGRVEGVKNKKTRAVAEALENTFEGLGGDEALKAFAEDNPDEFYKLWIKMMPRELKIEEVPQDPTMTSKEATKMIKDLQKAAKK